MTCRNQEGIGRSFGQRKCQHRGKVAGQIILSSRDQIPRIPLFQTGISCLFQHLGNSGNRLIRRRTFPNKRKQFLHRFHVLFHASFSSFLQNCFYYTRKKRTCQAKDRQLLPQY